MPVPPRVGAAAAEHCGGAVTILATSRELLRRRARSSGACRRSRSRRAGTRRRGASQAGAVALFCDARGRRPGFALTDDNVAAVIDVPRRVEGIPLAISSRPRAPRCCPSPDRGAPARLARRAVRRTAHRGLAPATLTGTLDWSHELLDERERCCSGGWRPSPAPARSTASRNVCGGEGLPRDAVLDVVGRLVAKSLVVVDEGVGASRFRLLEPIRRYAATRLAASDEETPSARAHRRHYLALAQATQRALLAGDPTTRRSRPPSSTTTTCARAARGARQDEPELALALVDAQWRSWFAAGRLVEAEGWVAAALDAAARALAAAARVLLVRSISPAAGMPPLAFASAEAGARGRRGRGDEDLVTSRCCTSRCSGGVLEPRPARRAAARRARSSRSAAPTRRSARVLGVAAAVAWSRGAARRGRPAASPAPRAARHSPATPCFVPIALGLVLEHRADSPPRLHNEDTLTPWRHVRADRAVVYMLVNRAAVARWRGDLEAAAAMLEDALARLARPARRRRHVARPAAPRRDAARPQRARRARELMQESLAIREQRGDASGVGLTRNALALLHARARRSRDARSRCSSARGRSRFAAGDSGRRDRDARRHRLRRASTPATWSRARGGRSVHCRGDGRLSLARGRGVARAGARSPRARAAGDGERELTMIARRAAASPQCQTCSGRRVRDAAARAVERRAVPSRPRRA